MARTEIVTGALNIETGVQRVFGLCDIHGEGFADGWAEPESEHIWNDGSEANLALFCKLPQDARCALEISGVPFIRSGWPKQVIALYGNGFRLGSWSLTGDRPQTLIVEIEPEQWFKRNGGSLMSLSWVFSNSVSLAELHEGQDLRHLAFCFQTLTVRTLESARERSI